MTDSQNISNDTTPVQVTVHVKLADFLSRIATGPEFDLEIQTGSTVEEIINVLTTRLGKEFCKAVVDRNGKLNAGIAVILNNQLIPSNQMVENTIHQDCKLSIIPIVGGG